MKRNPSIERLFRWRYFSHEKAPESIIPPRSVIRLVRPDPDWDPGLNIRDEFRIGYYRRQDGPNCVWLVDAAANYDQTWDQNFLLDYFEIVSLSDETDTYGFHRPVLEAQRLQRPSPPPERITLRHAPLSVLSSCSALSVIRFRFSLRSTMPTVSIETTPDPTPGARPAGTSSPDEAAASIQQMFSTIAPTYDRANHILSVGLDRTWWNRTARTLRPILQRPEAVVLDLCCGTGDLTLALDKHRPRPQPAVATTPGGPSFPASSERVGCSPPSGTAACPAPILALDFSHTMLTLAAKKFANKNIVSIEADALHLPLADNSVDLVTSAFGFRNLISYPAGLAELHRVLRPGGEIAILECNQPGGLIGWLYSAYFHHILPTLGGLISRNPAAYSYLPHSVARFPRPPQMKALIAAAGFTNPTWTSYTLGTAGLYRATKP